MVSLFTLGSMTLLIRIWKICYIEPYVTRTDFVASIKTLTNLQQLMEEKYHMTSSGSFKSLFENEVLPDPATLEFRSHEGKVGVMITNMNLVTDDNKRNKHLMGTIKVARPVFQEKAEIGKLLLDIESCFPEKRRKVEVLLY